MAQWGIAFRSWHVTIERLFLPTGFAMQRIDIQKSFPFPVSDLFAFFADHENLEKVFVPAKIRRIKDGEGDINGLGSVRRLRILMAPPFEETVTVFVPNERIEYRITRGSPLRNHHGVMRFSDDGQGGSHLHYTIEFEGKLPLVAAIVRAALDRGIRKALDGLRL